MHNSSNFKQVLDGGNHHSQYRKISNRNNHMHEYVIYSFQEHTGDGPKA
ncbi:hypothetical protein LINGRAHAP2_LOCUS7329, partial [Linum grandiflorum]